MAETGAGRDPERGAGGTSGVPAGALSALLRELADVPSQPVPLLLQAGDVIGRFEIVRKIGGGGFGVVFEARDQQLRRSVAFKLVRPGRLGTGADLLGREAEVIAQLSHPNLVTLFDVGRCEHGPYLVLELLRGETLHDRLARERVGVEAAVRVALEIARGLAHAHGRGVVHRDLKPSNVFLCEDGGAKLLDFGMSRAFGRTTVSGGTPSYMAPEQRRGAPEDERTDVYALGVMLFEMLAGALPFPADADGKEARATRKAPRLDVPQSPALAELVAGMLEPDPTERPRTGEVLDALARVQAGLRPAAPGEAGPAPRVRRRARWAWLAAGGVAAAVAFGALWAVARGRLVGAAPRGRAIAVLPFTNLSGSADNEYLSDGLTEEVLNLLTRLRELRVAARSSSFYFKEHRAPVTEIARRLGVDVVLEGSVRRDRDRLRVAAELIDARSGFHLWAQTYDRHVEDVFAIQEDIARQVVGGLEVALSSASQGELRKPRKASVAGYDLYLRGRAQLRLPTTLETVGSATSLFEQAIAADPEFAPAYAGLCEAWLARYERRRDADSYHRAESECGRALTRDPQAGEVLVALGNVHLASGRHEEAEREFTEASKRSGSAEEALLGLARTYDAERRAADAERAFDEAARRYPGDWRVHFLRGNFFLHAGRFPDAARSFAAQVALTPENPSAHSNLGVARYQEGEVERALAAFRSSLDLAPTRGAYTNVGAALYYLGRFEDAAAMYEKAIALAKDDHRIWGNLGEAYSHAAGRRADATAALRKAVELGEERLGINPADADALAELAYYHAWLGHADRARALAEEARARDPRNPYIHYYSALAAVVLRDHRTALDELERAVALGRARALLARDPGLDAIRAEPRFRTLAATPPQ